MKPKLIWPSIADELEASAKRRQSQRDREKRKADRTNIDNLKLQSSNTTTTPLNHNMAKNKSSTSKLSTSKDENLPPSFKQKTLTSYFTRKDKGFETQPATPARKNLDVSDSPTPIKKAKAAIGIRIESPNPKEFIKNEIRKNEQEAKKAPEQKEFSENRIERINKRLKKSLNKLNREDFLREMKSAVHLNDEVISAIPNQLIRYLVSKEAAQYKIDSTLRIMSLDERKNFRREFKEKQAITANFLFDQLHAEFLTGKYEDSVVLARKEFDGNELLRQFPQFNAIFPNRPNLTCQFGRILAINQFLNTHRNLLNNKQKFQKISATKLLEAMDQGKEGSISVEAILNVLVNFLAGRIKSKPPKTETRERRLRSRDVKMKTVVKNEPDVVYTLKLLAGRNKKAANQTQSDEGEWDDNEEEAAFSELDKVSKFYQLSIVHQLSIFEYLIERILSMDSFHIYMDEEARNEVADSQQNLTDLSEKIAKLRAELKELEAEQAHLDDLPNMTRRLSINATKIAHLQRRATMELENLEEELVQAKKHSKLLKFTYKYRTLPLGQDRFHRNYWFFANSSEGDAIFVQQEACQNCPTGMAGRAVGEEEQFVRKLQEKIEGRPCAGNQEECWWAMNTQAEFNQLLACLSDQGRREHRLKRALLEYRNLILENLSPVEVGHQKKGEKAEEKRDEKEEKESENMAEEEEEK